MKTHLQLASVVLVLLAAPATYAASTTFASRSAFGAAFPGATIENWDSYADLTTIANGSTLNGITYNFSSSIENVVVTNNFLPSTSPNVLGRTPLVIANGPLFVPGDTITFTFGSSLQAFGIDITTAATAGAAYQLTTNTGAVFNSVFDPIGGIPPSGQFAGFSTDIAFTSVTVSSSAAGFLYALDTLRFVPAPSGPGNGASVPDSGTTAVLLGFTFGLLLILHRCQWSPTPVGVE